MSFLPVIGQIQSQHPVPLQETKSYWLKSMQYKNSQEIFWNPVTPPVIVVISLHTDEGKKGGFLNEKRTQGTGLGYSAFYYLAGHQDPADKLAAHRSHRTDHHRHLAQKPS